MTRFRTIMIGAGPHKGQQYALAEEVNTITLPLPKPLSPIPYQFAAPHMRDVRNISYALRRITDYRGLSRSIWLPEDWTEQQILAWMDEVGLRR